MEAPDKYLNNQEKENVLLLLNEFSEGQKESTKATQQQNTSVKELTGKVNRLIEKMDSQLPGTASAEGKLQELTIKLDQHAAILRHPPSSKVMHHHYIPKIIWIAAAFFMMLMLISFEWYRTFKQLDEFQEGQIKYRYLKLTGSDSTKRVLFKVDSIYKSGFAMKDSVMQWEDEQNRFEELKEQLEVTKGKGTTLEREVDELQKRKHQRQQN